MNYNEYFLLIDKKVEKRPKIHIQKIKKIFSKLIFPKKNINSI